MFYFHKEMSTNSSIEDENDIYQLDFQKPGHGRVFIFNNFHFCKLGNKSKREECKKAGCRFGSDVDVKNLKILFKGLNFDVECLIDQTAKEIHDHIKEISEKKVSNIDCLIIIIMSYGQLDENGEHEIFTKNEYPTVYLKDFINPFKTVRALMNTPKLFFIDACPAKDDERFDLESDSNLSKKNCETISKTEPYVPIEADFLIIQNILHRVSSLKSEEGHSWYMKNLCETITECKENKDLLDILTKINNKIAKMGECNDEEEELFKTLPTCVHQLRKSFYFVS